MKINNKKILILAFVLSILEYGFAQKSVDYSPKVLIPYAKNGEWGYSDTLGKIICEPKFDSVSLFEVWHNTHAIIKKGNKYGIIDKDFNLVVEPKYKYLKGTNCCPKENLNFFQVGNGRKWGVDAASGKRVIPIKYDDIDFNFITLGFIAVKKGAKFALFTLAGEKITDFKFDYFTFGIFGGGNYNDLLGIAGEEYFLIKPDKTVIPAPEKPNSFNVDLSDPNTRDVKKLTEEEKENNSKISLEIKRKYDLDSVYLERPLCRASFKGNFIYVLVDKKGQKGVWDVKRKLINFIEYDDILAIRTYNKDLGQKYGFNELWYVQKNGKWGVVNEKGVIQIPFDYDGFGKISDSFAETKRNGKSGAVIYFTYYPPIACKYDSVDFFQQIEVTQQWAFGLYKVSLNGNIGYVGENGVEFFKFDK